MVNTVDSLFRLFLLLLRDELTHLLKVVDVNFSLLRGVCRCTHRLASAPMILKNKCPPPQIQMYCAGIFIINNNIVGSIVCQFIALVLFSWGIAVMADVVMYVLEPTRRSFGQAVTIMTSTALGEASSPYIVGVLSNYLQHSIIREHPLQENYNGASVYPVQVQFLAQQRKYWPSGFI